MVNHVPPNCLLEKFPNDGDTIQVIASLKDPTSTDSYNNHKSQLSWIFGANPPQFQYTCDHANHISTNVMHNMPCSCLKVVFEQAKMNRYWPLSNDDAVNGRFLTYLHQSRCYFVETCVSIAKNAIKNGFNTLQIIRLSKREVNDKVRMFVNNACKPPPKYGASVKTKGKRIRSKGEDDYPHRQFPSPSGPRDGKKIKGNLTLPLSQSKSAAVEDIIERDGNGIIISREALAEISALQRKKERTQPVDPLIKDIPVETEKLIDPGLFLIRPKQIDVEKPYYSPFWENEKSSA